MVFFVFIISCCIGSFINVIIYRLPRNLSCVLGRSFCPKCNRTLRALDLIPIIRYILLRGKCRYCNHLIPIRYLLVETISGIVGVICFIFIKENWLLVFVIFELLLAISVIDWQYMIIPDSLNLMFVIACFFLSDVSLIDKGIGCLMVSVPMFVTTIFIKDAFGGGDIKLMTGAGWLLGINGVLFAIYIASLIAGCYVLCLTISKRMKLDSHIPFGPFLSIGIILSYITNAPW